MTSCTFSSSSSNPLCFTYRQLYLTRNVLRKIDSSCLSGKRIEHSDLSWFPGHDKYVLESLIGQMLWMPGISWPHVREAYADGDVGELLTESAQVLELLFHQYYTFDQLWTYRSKRPSPVLNMSSTLCDRTRNLHQSGEPSGVSLAHASENKDSPRQWPSWPSVFDCNISESKTHNERRKEFLVSYIVI